MVEEAEARHFPAGMDWTAVDDELPLGGKAGETPVWFRFRDGYELPGVFERQQVREGFPYPYERFCCRHHPVHGCEWWWAQAEEPTQNSPTHWKARDFTAEQAASPEQKPEGDKLNEWKNARYRRVFVELGKQLQAFLDAEKERTPNLVESHNLTQFPMVYTPGAFTQLVILTPKRVRDVGTRKRAKAQAKKHRWPIRELRVTAWTMQEIDRLKAFDEPTQPA